MPIYEETYGAWQGQLEERPRTWWVIARTGVRLLWKKGMILLILLSSIPFFVRAVQIYLMTRFGDQIRIDEVMDRFRINPQFFYDFLQGQNFFLILILILAGAGLIANDRKFKALPLYFSKPVSFWDYIIGKSLVIGFYGSLVTLAPSLLLFLIRVFLAKDTAFLNEYFWIPISILAFVILWLLVLTGTVLALSAVSKGSRSAAILFFALWAFPEALREILSRIPSVGLFSLFADLRQVSTVFFGVNRPFAFPLWQAILVLMGVLGLCYGALRLKVRPTEVVR